jgi:LysM repeat protein
LAVGGVVRSQRRREIARLAAPAAFLLAATIAVLLVRAGLREGEAPSPDQPPPAVTIGPETVVVRAGDTLGSIALRSGTSVAVLEELNPGIDPVELAVGSRIRVK